ncbi:hypothetical protein CEXT_439241 [Caerostris extrusa]|uniref:Uncharacterized protein n=1 Tax=Caerostris extrusa TaxID=172846 RepID=A0AAV4N2E3_CAEEX|nr:hypothetical protein CEXT_439241 [Caerostris extrusa]
MNKEKDFFFNNNSNKERNFITPKINPFWKPAFGDENGTKNTGKEKKRKEIILVLKRRKSENDHLRRFCKTVKDCVHKTKLGSNIRLFCL